MPRRSPSFPHGPPRRGAAAFALLAALGGCAAESGFEHRTVALPAAFSSGDAEAAPTVGAWWERFDDPTLDALVERALAGNPDLGQAAARIRQARARERIVVAGSAPSVEAAAQAGYTRISENAIPRIPGAGGEGGDGEPAFGLPGMDFTTFRAGFDASWEADLFGRRRDERAAAAARTEAAIWSARDAEVALAAEVGDAYLRYRLLQQRIALAERRLEMQRALVGFAEARARSGVATTIALRRREQAASDLAAAVADLDAQQSALLNGLAVLLGETPERLAVELEEPSPPPAAGFEVPPGLPSQLLLRRPDLREAERRLAAAVSDIGAARAALFPTIELTGLLQLVSTSLAELLTPGSLQIDGAARIAMPILDGGRRRATLDLRRAEAEEAAEAYRAQTIDALHDVENALVRLEADRRRQTLLAASEAAARDAAASLAVRFRNGLVPEMDAIEARQALVAAEEARLEAGAAAAADLVALYKALGGGWDDRENAND